MENPLRYALITGASSGIGWHFAEALAKKGYSVVAVSNQPAQLEDLKKSLEQAYRITVVTINIDLAQQDSAQKVFDYCNGENLKIEVLINNAGIFVFGEVASVDYSRIKSILMLHILTPALLCRLFGEQMIERKEGFILNVSSITAVMPYPGISIYGPTKAFIRKFTRALRTEMKSYGINVTCLLPGAANTALYDTSNFKSPLLVKTGLMKKPDSVANAGVRALFKNRAECTPGLLNKLIIVLIPIVPHFIIGIISRRTHFLKKPA
ncbi:MAG: SDR family NAD(P)-dependent oxidoreductase [Bacteroidales bacterium]